MKKKIILIVGLIFVLLLGNSWLLCSFAQKVENENVLSEKNVELNSENKENSEELLDDKSDNSQSKNDSEKNNTTEEVIEKEENKEINEDETTEIKKSNKKALDENSNNVDENVVETTKSRSAAVLNPSVQYKAHVQNVGWQSWKKDSEIAGTTGQSLRVEALKINIEGFDSSVSIKYQVHIQNIGWQSWKTNGELAGTEGQALRLEALKIKLVSADDYSIMYRTHVENIGWQDWRYDGEIAGTEGMSYRIEAIQIKIVKKTQRGKVVIDTPENNKNIYNKKIIDVNGWKMSNYSNSRIDAYFDDLKIEDEKIEYYKKSDLYGSVYGGYGSSTENPMPGYKFSVDVTNVQNGTHKIKVQIVSEDGSLLDEATSTIYLYNDFHIAYSAHVQSVGWQKYVDDNKLAGTEGRSLRMEALKVNLVNAPANARIRYRTHIQNIGWQDWVYDNSIAGTQGQSLRMEAIQIQLDNLDDFTVEYQVHVQDLGWSQWSIDGEIAGTMGLSKRIEAIRIRLVPNYKRRYVGIDVSVFNGNIDWNAVKGAGIDYAMIRVGFRGYGSAGTLVEDSRFRENIERAKAAGVKVGVYFVTQATNESEAIEEANWVINRISAYQIDYPVAIDVEFSSESNHNGRADHLDKNTRTVLIKRFCERIQSAGYTPMIYLNVDWAYNYVVMSQLWKYDTWIAHYRNNPSLTPGYNGAYTMWQYTSFANISGVSGNVDCNICYKKY